MARVTEALEVASVAELLPVALVVGDVVDVRGADAATMPRALAAKRLEKKLSRA